MDMGFSVGNCILKINYDRVFWGTDRNVISEFMGNKGGTSALRGQFTVCNYMFFNFPQNRLKTEYYVFIINIKPLMV